MTKRPSGFALAAVLWLLAGLTILAAMISQSSQIVAERQAKLRQRAEAEQDFLSSRSEALYWLSSSRATQDGFGWGTELLRVDSRGYSGTGKTTIHVQDVRGLLNLYRPNRLVLGRLLLLCGAEQSKIDSLLDTLEDYQEKGDLKRVNGAKALDYSMAGMPPPRYAPLLAEPEIWQILGWKTLQRTWNEKQCFEDVTVRGESRINLGTATPKVLQAYGLPQEQVGQLDKERQRNSRETIDLMQAREASTSFFGIAEGTWPSRSFRITHSAPDMPWVLRYDLRLTTSTAGSPWEIYAPRRLPKTSVIIPAGRAAWPRVDQLSEQDKNAITQPSLPF
ncbi:MAG: general secretion pathway protein GspK [Burkholderiales bacterium]|nr:general secretion pathway protein GspK [Burkholderiales bacterium]